MPGRLREDSGFGDKNFCSDGHSSRGMMRSHRSAFSWLIRLETVRVLIYYHCQFSTVICILAQLMVVLRSVKHPDSAKLYFNSPFQRWSASFDCRASWKAHDGITLSSIITKRKGCEVCLVTGGNDSNIKVN